MATVESGTSLAQSLLIQKRVIGALLMREVLTRYGRHNIGFLWLFAEPMIFTLGITALWSATKATHGSNLPIVAFAVTGYSAILVWRNMAGRTIGALQPNLSLMYHRNVRPIDIYASRLILELLGASASFLVLSLIFISLGMMQFPEDILKVLMGWVMLIWFGMSLALTLGTLSERSELVDKIWHPAAYLLFPLSGSAFMVDWLPPAFQNIVLYFPMVHGVEMVREGYFGSSVHAHYSLSYMAVCCLILTAIGFSQERVVSRKVIPE